MPLEFSTNGQEYPSSSSYIFSLWAVFALQNLIPIPWPACPHLRAAWLCHSVDIISQDRTMRNTPLASVDPYEKGGSGPLGLKPMRPPAKTSSEDHPPLLPPPRA